MIINSPKVPIPDGFEYKRASNDDCEQIVKLVHATLNEYNLIPEPEAADKDLSDVERHYSNGYFGLVTKDKKIVATFGLSPLDNNTTEIRKMYAAPQIRGKGLGKWMVNYLIQISRENGYTEVELETATQLKEAIGLYQKLGFREKHFDNKTPRCDKSFILPL